MTTFTVTKENFTKINQLNDLFTEYNVLTNHLKSVEQKIRALSVMSDDDSITDVVETVNAADDKIATVAAIAGFIS